MTSFNYLADELVKSLSVNNANAVKVIALLEVAYQLKRIADKLEEK